MKSLLFVMVLALAITGCAGNKNVKATADRQATAETVKLLEGLKSLQQEGIMFGHQDDLSYGHTWVYPNGESDVRAVCSDFPAVYGMDLGHFELSSPINLDTVPFEEMRTHVRSAYSRGGIVTFSWHLNNPLTGGTAWDVTSDKVVASVLPGGGNHEKYKKWLDNIAGFFLSLNDDQGKPIPVIFRPYHEHTGSWFWWGQKLCTADEFRGLWRFTVEYLGKTCNVHNLLYAYSSSGDFTSAEEYLERYPGDDYIDIMGFDTYQFPETGNKNFTENLRAHLGILAEAAKSHGKVHALTEVGYESIPDTTWWTRVLWPAVEGTGISYLLVWRNAHNRPEHFYAPWPGQVSANDFIDFYNLPGTLFQEDITIKAIYK